jgi:alpha-tubulin suppressor-like RCC1 family protein
MKLLSSLSSLVVAALVVTVLITACGKKNSNMVVSSAAPAGLYATSLAFRNSSTVAWGFNGNGQLGQGNNDFISPIYAPVVVPGLLGMTGVAVGGSHCLAFKNNTTVWAWGNNYSGQLGTGVVNNAINTIATSVPGQVVKVVNASIVLLTGVTAISAGGNHSLALDTNGTVWSWGGNYYGQLGDAAAAGVITPNRSVADTVKFPNTPGSVTTGIATMIAAGGSHNLALMSNYSSAATHKVPNAVLAWGLNDYGQLGNNTSTTIQPYSTIPVLVYKNDGGTISPLNNVKFIAAGGSHSLAFDGTNIWAWGTNTVGQLGTGSVDPPSTQPITHIYAVKVDTSMMPLPLNVLQITAGLDHSLVLLSGGSVWAWGSNFFGQLGNGGPLKGSPANQSAAFPTPAPVVTLTGITNIVAIGTHNLAQAGNKIMWAWGENTYGQLGNGSNFVNSNVTAKLDSSTPVPVIGFP